MPKRKTSDSPDLDNEPKPNTTVTGEKRKRGRPRKYPEHATPKPAGPKRGRGRPRKAEHEKVTPKKTTPKEGKRGRPRKYPLPNGDTKADSVEAKDDDDDDNDDDEEEEEEDEEEDEEDGSDRSYWLMKAEPESRLEKGVDVKFSIDDLREAEEPEPWDGIRNPTARKHLRDMKKGDYAFFYHSNCKVPGIVGVMEIVQEHSPDETALDPASPYYDEKATPDDPKWDVVHVEFRQKFRNMITLNDLKAHFGPGRPLENLQTLKQSRLSVSWVSPLQWKFIMKLVEEKPGVGTESPSQEEESEVESVEE